MKKLDPIYNEINGISYIAPNAETNRQRRNFKAIAAAIIGFTIGILAADYVRGLTILN